VSAAASRGGTRLALEVEVVEEEGEGEGDAGGDGIARETRRAWEGRGKV
jgi:hypothetical protein